MLGKRIMRYVAWLAVSLPLAACGSGGSGQSATLVLNNPTWDRVNVEAVITIVTPMSRPRNS
jgi:hypothetical protein